MKYNTIFMFNTYTYDIYIYITYDIKYNVKFLCRNKVLKFPLAFCKRNIGKLVCFWHIGRPS